MHKARHPPHIFHHFAFSGQVTVTQTPLHKGKEKNATLKWVNVRISKPEKLVYDGSRGLRLIFLLIGASLRKRFWKQLAKLASNKKRRPNAKNTCFQAYRTSNTSIWLHRDAWLCRSLISIICRVSSWMRYLGSPTIENSLKLNCTNEKSKDELQWL